METNIVHPEKDMIMFADLEIGARFVYRLNNFIKLETSMHDTKVVTLFNAVHLGNGNRLLLEETEQVLPGELIPVKLCTLKVGTPFLHGGTVYFNRDDDVHYRMNLADGDDALHLENDTLVYPLTCLGFKL